MNVDLTKGDIATSLIKFSLPMIIGNIFQQMYNIVDTLIVGRLLGEVSLIAVGSSFALMVLLSSIIIGFCMGASIVTGYYYGSKDIKSFKIASYNGFLFILTITIFINIIAFALVDKFIIWLNIPSQAVFMTKAYLNYIFFGIFFIFIYNYLACLLRSIGNSKLALYFLILATCLNIILDYIFIKYLKMNVEGAALATVIAQFSSATGMLIYTLRKNKNILPSKNEMVINKNILREIIDNSLLTAIQQSIMNFGILMIQSLVNSFGIIISAGFIAAVKIDSLAYIPVQDFGNAFSNFVAINKGAGHNKRIMEGLKTSLIISTIFSIIISIIVFLNANKFMSLFVNDINVVKAGVSYLRVEGSFYLGIGILFIWYGFYRGLKKSFQSIILTIISLGLRVSLAYILSSIIGEFGIWISIVIGWLIADIYALVVYKKKTKKSLI